MRYGLYKKTHFENFGNRAFCQRTAVLMNLQVQWLPVQRILLEVLVLTYNLSGIFSIS